MSTLILPGEKSPADTAHEALATRPGVIYLRSPKTGVIFRFRGGDPKHEDTIKRCLSEGFTLATEAECKAQAVELAELQGRPLPAWASEKQDADPAAGTADDTESHLPAHRRGGGK